MLPKAINISDSIEFKSINTAASGIQICEHLPKVAAQMKHMSIIRSLSTTEGDHEGPLPASTSSLALTMTTNGLTSGFGVIVRAGVAEVWRGDPCGQYSSNKKNDKIEKVLVRIERRNWGGIVRLTLVLAVELFEDARVAAQAPGRQELGEQSLPELLA